MAIPGEHWTRAEVEAVVADYFSMLADELTGRAFNKAEHNRKLRNLIGRSRTSIERKHQNVSAVLRELGQPWIDGYKPLGHAQGLLEDVIVERLTQERSTVVRLLDDVVDAPVLTTSEVTDLSQVEVAPPELAPQDYNVDEPKPHRTRISRLRNYIEVDAKNRSLGRAGEEFVVEFERKRLWDAGRPELSTKVEHAAATQGDGLGYDVSSFELDARPRLIEVKTTSFGLRTPFFISRNEVDASEELAQHYQLYRVFKFRSAPKFFALKGRISSSCHLNPHQFIASFRCLMTSAY